MRTDETHDPALRSWVESANDPTTDFPIQNLPFGIFQRRKGIGGSPGIGVAIGDRILDLTACAKLNLLTGDVAGAARFVVDDSLNRLMAQGPGAATSLRRALVELLREGSPASRRANEITVAQADAQMLLPVQIGDYSDFYASIHHATNVGRMFRPDNPLLPNYKYVPIGYHGRASSIVVSGTPVHRPAGQTRDGDAPPTFGPSKRLDYEIEVGAYIGVGNELGASIPIGAARAHVWGLSLVNDWSARDIQTWEYQPLGPFLAKSFTTSVSPWVVTLDALAPFGAPVAPRPAGDPLPLSYLLDAEDQQNGGFALTTRVMILTSLMRAKGIPPFTLSTGDFKDMYWTVSQLVAHHASNGCNLRTGDLLASGTISGPTPESRGCLLERASRGSEPLQLPSGEQRSFLEDGDEVIMHGFAERAGYRRIGLGKCAGIVTASEPT